MNKEKGMKGLEFDAEDPRQFWVELIGMKEGKKACLGKLKLSIDIYPKNEAEASPAERPTGRA